MSGTRDVMQSRPRPNSQWICGFQELGVPCSQGPTANGKCAHTILNRSVASDATNQIASPCSSCTRECENRNCELPAHSSSATQDSSVCEHTQFGPCTPVRAAWSWRQSLTLNIAILTGGLLLLFMTLPQREAIFVPGVLSSKHAQILENKVVSERCSLCHPNAHAVNDTGNVVTQDELCSRCHSGHFPNLNLRSPHDLTRQELRQLTLKTTTQHDGFENIRDFEREQSIARLIDHRSNSPSDNTHKVQSIPSKSTAGMVTHCASCHVEHHGRESDLQAISDQRCQACHVEQFESFVSGHPEFTNYPPIQPRRIAFNHQTHHDKHFAKQNETFECTTCHVDAQQRGSVGSVFRTLSFEASCARCHDKSIQAATIDAWVMLQLPSISSQNPQHVESELSDWPASAQFGYEGSVPLPMRILLMSSTDARLRTTLAQLPKSGELTKLPEFEVVGPDAVRNVAVATRQLINEIASGGQAAWRARLEKVAVEAVSRPLSQREHTLIDELCAGLPPDIFRLMQSSWFGNSSALTAQPRTPSLRFISLAHNIDSDLLDSQSQAQSTSSAEADALLLGSTSDDLLLGVDALKATPPKLARFRGAVHVQQGGWYLDHETSSLRYMPRGHADPTLAAWAEFANLLATNRRNELSDVGAVDIQSHGSLAGTVPGGCVQCHLLDTPSSPELSAWKGFSKSSTERRLTKFDHTPHLTLPTLSDCRHCHELNSSAAIAEALSTWGPVECDFKLIRLDHCSACHRPQGAEASCVQCHNYHVTVR